MTYIKEEFDTLELELFLFLCNKYVQRADSNQKSMNLQYMEAETHDLAKEITNYLFKRQT